MCDVAYMKADNDDEPTDTWIELAAATANATRFLQRDQQNDRRDHAEQNKQTEQDPEQERKDIERRLKRLRAMEERLRR